MSGTDRSISGRCGSSRFEREEIPQHLVFYAKALINSYPKVPFVDLHATYESYIDTMMYSHQFIGRLKQDDWWSFSRYTFDYDRKRAVLEKGERDTIVSKRDTIALDQVFEDGLSLFFTAGRPLERPVEDDPDIDQ